MQSAATVWAPIERICHHLRVFEISQILQNFFFGGLHKIQRIYLIHLNTDFLSFSRSAGYTVQNSRAREHAVQLRVQPGRAASSAARCVTSQTHRRRTPAELSPQSLQICGWSCLNNCGNVTREHLSCKTGCNGV